MDTAEQKKLQIEKLCKDCKWKVFDKSLGNVCPFVIRINFKKENPCKYYRQKIKKND